MRDLDRNLLNPDFVEFLQCLHSKSVESILVGGYAVVLHGYFRTTGDMDVWIRPTAENYRRMRSAFAVFGFPTEAISEAAITLEVSNNTLITTNNDEIVVLKVFMV